MGESILLFCGSGFFELFFFCHVILWVQEFCLELAMCSGFCIFPYSLQVCVKMSKLVCPVLFLL